MPKASKKGKKSKSNKPSRVKYRLSNKKVKNKIQKIEQEIKRNEKIKERNPDSKVDTTIQQLKTRKTEWNKKV
jgi:hypothetical protein